MKDLVKVLKATADPARVRILKLLEQKNMCVCELTEILGIGQPTVSHHLKMLKAAGLVKDFREGVWINYAISKGGGSKCAAQMLKLVSQAANTDPVVIKDIKRAERVDRKELCS